MIVHYTKSELVFNHLLEMIQSGELKPGEIVSAVEIAAKLGVSRTPVNEAVKRLIDKNLITLLPNVGFQVKTLPLSDVLDLIELKMILEKTAIQWIKDRNKPINLDSLHVLNERIRTAVKSGNKVIYNKAVRDFHIAFMSVADSQPLLDSFMSTWDYSGWEDTRFQELSEDLESQCNDHDLLLQYLKDKKYSEAMDIMTSHGERWVKLMKKSFYYEEK